MALHAASVLSTCLVLESHAAASAVKRSLLMSWEEDIVVSIVGRSIARARYFGRLCL